MSAAPTISERDSMKKKQMERTAEHHQQQQKEDPPGNETINNNDDTTTDKMMDETVKLDDFYQLGKYTYVVCLLAELLILAQVGNMLYMSYAGAAPTLVQCGNHTFLEKEKGNERCQIMARLEKSNEANCSRLNASWAIQFHSVNVEFDKHCETQDVKDTISIQMIGVIIGSALFGYLSDSYGRRKTMLVALILCILTMLATSFTIDLISFTIVRFFVNFFNAGTMVTLVVFTSEHYPKKYRFCLSNLITWSPNFVLFALLAWAAGDWRALQIFSALLATPCVPILFFLSESPRFLVQRRRMAAAKAAILRMHRFDGRDCNEAVLDAVLAREARQDTKEQKKYNYFHLFYTWRFVRYTTAVALSFFVVSIMNYSLIFSMEKLSGNMYFNHMMMGGFRYSMNLSIAFGDMYFKWLGRKFAHFLADALATAAFLLYIFLDLHELRSDLPFLANWSLLSVIGFCSLLYTTNGLAANELFPTGVRNASYSFGQVLSRIGVVLGPQLFAMSSHNDSKVWSIFPYLLLMILAVIDAFYFQFNVIETKDRPMGSKFPEKEERIFYGKFRRAKGRNADTELLPSGANATEITEEAGKDVKK